MSEHVGVVSKVAVTRNEKLDLSMQGNHNAICIGKDIIRILGCPTHVCLRVNDEGSRLVVQPCAADDVMSFKVPDKLMHDHHCVFRVYSKQFVHSIMNLNGMAPTQTYNITGVYTPQRNVVWFDLREHRLFENRK